MTHPVAWTAEEFEARLRAKQAGYHIHHPFNLRMRAGECTPEEIRTWVANRFYYQVNIPLKDAAILSNCPDRATRREWIVRIHDHDGDDDCYSTTMSELEVLTLSTLKALLLDLKGLYLVTYAWLFGMCEYFKSLYHDQETEAEAALRAVAFWVTFFGGMSRHMP